MKLKNMLKDKTTKIVLFSLLANMAVLYLIAPAGIDILSILLYAGVGILITKLADLKRVQTKHFFMLGGAISIAYNGLGHVFQLFDVTLLFLFIAAAQQALVTWITSKIMGVRK